MYFYFKMLVIVCQVEYVLLVGQSTTSLGYTSDMSSVDLFL